MQARLLPFALTLLLVAPSTQAQQWLVNSVINNQIVETAICDSALKRHQKLPDICAKYPKYSGAASASGKAPLVAKREASTRADIASLKFTPATGDDSVKKLAGSLGSDAQQRQQILQLAGAGKLMFEQRYAGKDWNNNIAGAMAFFIIAIHSVQTDREPDAAAQDALFASLVTVLAQSDIVKAPSKDKTALYNTLLACAGLPLVFYVDGKQQGNAAEVEGHGKWRRDSAGNC